MRWSMALLAAAGAAIPMVLPVPASADVPVDVQPSVAVLPAQYPQTFVFVQEMGELTAGAFAVVDVAAPNRQYKGLISGGYLPSLLLPRTRNEFYVATTYFSRGTYGIRTDVLTINDKTTLKAVDEIILPDQKRALVGGVLGKMQLTRDEKFALIFNFTPASSVTVVDLAERKVANVIDVPGCTYVYPTGERSFSSLCADGTLATFELGEGAKVVKEARTGMINQIDTDAYYMEPVTIQNVSYFSTSGGNVRLVDLSTNIPKILPGWQLISDSERKEGWITAVGEMNSADLAKDDANRLYVRVRKKATQDRSPVTEVWVYDVAAKKRIARMPMADGAGTIFVTPGSKPYLVVTQEKDFSHEAAIDVYDAQTGKLEQTIGGWKQGTVLFIGPAHE